MRRTTSVVNRFSIALLAAGLLAAGSVAAPAAALADDPPSSRGSIHEDAARQASADYRKKFGQKRDSAEAGDSLRSEVVRVALAQVGDDYDSGADGPNAFDCSGLVVYAYRSVGVDLEHYSWAQYKSTQRISLKDARPGDLAFYFENGAHHVAIYTGDGKVVHASDYGIGVVKGVVKGTPWTNEHFTGMGRVKLPG